MELPTYTSIWRIEKRLYKLYDFRLPMPLPVGQIAVFTAITVPYLIILTVLGLPFNHNLFWLYVLPPGVLTWLATRPVLESKRLPELISSQLRYLGEPSAWCRMAPLAEKDEIAVYGRVWRQGHPALVAEAVEVADAAEIAAVADAEQVAGTEQKALPRRARQAAQRRGAQRQGSQRRGNQRQRSQRQGTQTQRQGSQQPEPGPQGAGARGRVPQRPALPQSRLAQPGPAQPGFAQPGPAQPGLAQPGLAQPGRAQSPPPEWASRGTSGSGQRGGAPQPGPGYTGRHSVQRPGQLGQPGQPGQLGQPGQPPREPGQVRARGTARDAAREVGHEGVREVAHEGVREVAHEDLHAAGYEGAREVAHPRWPEGGASRAGDGPPAWAPGAESGRQAPDRTRWNPDPHGIPQRPPAPQDPGPASQPGPAGQPSAASQSSAAQDPSAVPGQADGLPGGLGIPEQRDGEAPGAGAVPPQRSDLGQDAGAGLEQPGSARGLAGVPGQAGGLLGGGLGVPEQRDGEAQGAGAGPERPSGEHSVPGQAGGLPGGLGVPEQRDGAAQGLGAGPASGGPQQPGAAGQEAAGQEAAGQGRGPWSLLVPGQAGSDPLGAGAGERASGVAQDAPGPEREAQDSLAPGAGEMDDAGLQAWTAALAESGSGWPAEPGSDEPEQAGHWSEAADASEAAEAEAVESAAGESVGESVGEATADAEWDGGRPRRLPPITIVPAQRFSAGAEKAREGAAEPAGDDTAARQSRDGIADARPREGGLPDTSAPAVERALGRPGVRPAAGWRTHVTVVPGGQGPGRPDPIKEAKARAVLPLDRPHLVMVLGCTVGAGQTVTAWMIAELLASLRGEPVAALDLNPGPASLKELAGLPAIPVSTLLGPRAHTGQPAHAAPRRERAAKGTRAAPPRPDVICDDPAGEGSWTAGGSGISGGPGGPGIRLVTSEDTDGADTGGADTGGRAPEGWAPEGSAAGQAASADFADFGLGPDAGEFGPGEFGPGEFGHGTGGHARAGYAGGLSGRPSRLFEFLASRYPVTLVDPGAAAVGRVLPAADQLVLVAPASPDAARAVGMTLEWLHANGHGILSANSIVVLNGVSQRSVPHAEQAGLVVRGRCRAIVRVPWDDHLAEPEAERGIRDSLARADTPSRLERLRPPVLQAYTALAGVLVSALAAGPQRGRAAR